MLLMACGKLSPFQSLTQSLTMLNRENPSSRRLTHFLPRRLGDLMPCSTFPTIRQISQASRPKILPPKESNDSDFRFKCFRFVRHRKHQNTLRIRWRVNVVTESNPSPIPRTLPHIVGGPVLPKPEIRIEPRIHVPDYDIKSLKTLVLSYHCNFAGVSVLCGLWRQQNEIED